MISVKYAVIMALGAFAAGSFFASPLPEAIASTIANDVICNGCVGTSDLAGNAVTASKIKDSEVKAAEIATDAVGASELKGVTKLIFAECTLSFDDDDIVGSQTFIGTTCDVPGADGNDKVIVSKNANRCFEILYADAGQDGVALAFKNDCNSAAGFGTATISIIVYDT